MEDLSISATAKIKAGGKDIQLTDLKPEITSISN